MTTDKKKKRFEELVSGRSSLLHEIEWREKNEAWLEESARIAILIINEVKQKNWDKQDLAFRMGVTPQYISKLVKGNENLSLETITKLEKVLDIEILNKQYKQTYEFVMSHMVLHYKEKTSVLYHFDNLLGLKKVFVGKQRLANNTTLVIDKNEPLLYEEEKAR